MGSLIRTVLRRARFQSPALMAVKAAFAAALSWGVN